jgi:DEAD/DEAH box helicase domain-containing protein
VAEAADLLAGIVRDAGRQSLAFVKSRKGGRAGRAGGTHGDWGRTATTIGSSPTGRAYLAEERRAVERGLIDGSVRGVAATDALELGVDVGALDAVVIGRVARARSRRCGSGPAGRDGATSDALVVFVADDDPLDHYLLAHPEARAGAGRSRPPPTDVTNPYVLDPHLRCAAFELPLAKGRGRVRSGGDVAELLAVGGRRGQPAGARWPLHYWAGRGSPARGVGDQRAPAVHRSRSSTATRAR